MSIRHARLLSGLLVWMEDIPPHLSVVILADLVGIS